MKVYPHWWYDESYWVLDANDWKDDAVGVEIEDELVERYLAARKELGEVNTELYHALKEAGYKQGSLFE